MLVFVSRSTVETFLQLQDNDSFDTACDMMTVLTHDDSFDTAQ